MQQREAYVLNLKHDSEHSVSYSLLLLIEIKTTVVSCSTAGAFSLQIVKPVSSADFMGPSAGLN